MGWGCARDARGGARMTESAISSQLELYWLVWLLTYPEEANLLFIIGREVWREGAPSALRAGMTESAKVEYRPSAER